MSRVTKINNRCSQSGFTIISGLVILAAMTYIVVSSVNINMIDLKIASNMESKEMLRLSAIQAIEQVMNDSSSFATPAVQTIVVNGHSVAVAAPQCLKSSTALGYSAVTALSSENTDWSFSATATDLVTGAQVELHQGVKIKLLSDSCP